MTPYWHRFRSRRELAAGLERLGADKRCLPYFDRKRETLSLVFPELDFRAANALKQELLSRGGDVAVHRQTIDGGIEKSDCILIGTEKQLRMLADKLEAMPYWGLPTVRTALTEALDNLHTAASTLQLPGDRTLTLDSHTRIMGILNRTPDSFYAGSRVASRGTVATGGAMLEAGAAILDIGAESSRPGSEPVSEDEEMDRLLPDIEALRRAFPGAVLSADTTKASVARAAVEAGADMVNDISGFAFDEAMAPTVARLGVPTVLMHIKGTPKTMQRDPHYHHLFAEMTGYFDERVGYALRCGIRRDQLILDPGIGFGKRKEDNLAILRHLEAFRTFGLPLLVGHSRKSTIGRVTGEEDPAGRLEGTLAVSALCAWQGVPLIRVHDVAENAKVLRTIQAVKG
ncbi:MAG: dihydropteroate synthase [Synergistales bacterium]|nr:dihydropteroate synthase [Synergistales bacterium]